MSLAEARGALAEACRLAADKGLLHGQDGNLSLRAAGGALITPAGRAKAELGPGDMMLVDGEGAVLEGGGRPSAETGMHLAAYAARPEVNAVVHAHPPHACALAASGASLLAGALPEVLVHLGPVPTAPYATPGSPELVEAVRPYLAGHDALLLANHGTLCLGPDLKAALTRSEVLEGACRVQLLAAPVGGLQELPPAEQARLLALGGRGPAPGAPPPLAERIRLDRLPLTGDFAVEKRHRDGRGEAHLIVDNAPIRRVALLSLEPGTGYRGAHVHRAKTEGFYLAKGRARVELVCAQSGERLTLELEEGDRLFLPPGIAHRIEALEPVWFVELVDRPYDPDDDAPFDF